MSDRSRLGRRFMDDYEASQGVVKVALLRKLSIQKVEGVDVCGDLAEYQIWGGADLLLTLFFVPSQRDH